MKTDYRAHDGLYKRLRAKGKPGWSTEAHIQEKIGEGLSHYAPKHGRLLELGCGDGEVSLGMAKRGFEVYGVDISTTAIEWAREKAKERNLKAEFTVGDVLNLRGFEDAYFDFVFDGSCFHCIIGEDRKAFLASAYRVLKKGGFLHVRTICGEIWNEEALESFDKESRCLIREGNIAYRYVGLPQDIVNEIKDAGFRILEWQKKRGSRDPEHHDYGMDRLLVAAVKG